MNTEGYGAPAESDGGPAVSDTRFEFATASRIIFGVGRLLEAGDVARSLGRRALVVTGRTSARAEPLLAVLRKHGVSSVTFSVSGEPDVDAVRRGAALGGNEQCDLVVGFGGGGALDAAKAIAALVTNPGDVLDYLELIGRGQALSVTPLPCLAVPTTAGTGSEMTWNSVLASPEHRVKVSLRSRMMLARFALIDPELTYDLPPAVTAATGLDALTQLIEPFVCTRANPLTDAVCVEGLGRVARSLRTAFANGRDQAAREDMAVASLFGGMALANAGLGAVHGLAGPLGGMCTVPHGVICANLLPHAVVANLSALRRREPESDALLRYDTIARLLTGEPTSTAGNAVGWLRALATDLGIPRLGSYGIGAELTTELVEKAARASSMKANPIELTRDELAEIFESAL